MASSRTPCSVSIRAEGPSAPCPNALKGMSPATTVRPSVEVKNRRFEMFARDILVPFLCPLPLCWATMALSRWLFLRHLIQRGGEEADTLELDAQSRIRGPDCNHCV